MLRRHDWPGNIRELKNIMERAVLLSDNNSLSLNLEEKKGSSFSEESFEDMPTINEVQRRYIRFVLKRTN